MPENNGLFDYKDSFGRIPAAAAVIEITTDAAGAPNDFIFRYMNESCERLEGFSVEDTKGKTFYTLFPLADRRWAKFYGETASTGKRNVANALRPEIGKFLHIECSRLAPGICVCFLTDLTNEEKLHQRRESESRTFMDSISNSRLRHWTYDIKTGSAVLEESTQRQFGLPHIMENYPRSLFETNILLSQFWKQSLEGHQMLRDGEKEVSWEQQIWPPAVKEPRWERVIYTNIFDEKGCPVRAVGTAVDITEEKRLESICREHDDIQGMMIGSVYDAFRVNVTQNRVNIIKDSIPIMPEDTAAVTLSDFFERSSEHIMDPLSLVKYKENYNRATLISDFEKGVRSFAADCRCRTQHGEIKWLSIRMYLIKSENDGDIAGVIFSIDITEKKQNEIAMEAALARTCDLVLRINIKSGAFAAVFQTPAISEFFAACGNYEQEVKGAAESGVFGGQKSGAVKEALSIKIITQNLILKDEYVVNWTASDQGRDVRHELRFSYIDKSKKELCMTHSSERAEDTANHEGEE